MCISVQPFVDRFAAAGEDLLVAHHVALGVAQVGAKRAEGAAIDADVRRVQVRVDVVVGDVAVLPLADEVGQLADFVQRHIRAFEDEAVVEREPLAGFDLFADGFEEVGGGGEHDERGCRKGDTGGGEFLMERCRAGASPLPNPPHQGEGTGRDCCPVTIQYHAHEFSQQVQGADDEEAQADDRVHVKKGDIHAGKVVRADERVFVDKQDGDGDDGCPEEPAEERIDERQAGEQGDGEAWQTAASRSAPGMPRRDRNAVQSGRSVELEVLAGVDDVEARDPREDGGAENDGWQEVDRVRDDGLAANGDPGGDRRERQGGAEPEVGERREALGVTVAGKEERAPARTRQSGSQFGRKISVLAMKPAVEIGGESGDASSRSGMPAGICRPAVRGLRRRASGRRAG